MKPTARVDDTHKCDKHGGEKIIEGSPNVFISNKPAARQDDPTDHDGKITSGSSNVKIGSGGNSVNFGNKGTINIGGNGREVNIGGNNKIEDILDVALGIVSMVGGLFGDEAGVGEVTQIAGYKLTKHALERMAERNVSKEAVEDALKNPLKVSDVKYDPRGWPSQRYIGKNADVAINPENKNIVSVNPVSSERINKLNFHNSTRSKLDENSIN